MKIDESKLPPFDLERAKAGEKVLFKLNERKFAHVIESPWVSDSIGWMPVLIRDDNIASWHGARTRHLYMAPRTKTVWYALSRMQDGTVHASDHTSEAELRAYLDDDEILAIHSIEVPEWTT